MDILSYKLGQKSGGGGGGGSFNAFIDAGYIDPGLATGIANYITNIGSISMGEKTSMAYVFSSLPLLEGIEALDTSNVVSFEGAFSFSPEIKNIPLMDTSKAENMQNMFYNCKKLTEESLDNILQMCINATSYSGDKILGRLGVSTSNYDEDLLKSLPHYQDFIDAGWTLS